MNDELRAFIREKGYDFEPEHLDGAYHEFKTDTCKGWYVGSRDGDLVSLTFGDWRDSDVKHTYVSITDLPSDVIESVKKKHDEKKEAQQLLTKSFVEKLWNRWQGLETLPANKYWVNKKLPIMIGTQGQRVFFKGGDSGNTSIMVIPMYDVMTGECWNIQYVGDDGTKSFQPGGRIKGLCHPFGMIDDEDEKRRWHLYDDNKIVYVGEGFATCAAFHSATGASVLAAFSASNIKNVCEGLLNLGFSKDEIFVVADWDGKGPINTGMCEAQKIFEKWGIECVVPGTPRDKSVDFSDLHVEGEIPLEFLCAKHGERFFKEHDFVGAAKKLKSEKKSVDEKEVSGEVVIEKSEPRDLSVMTKERAEVDYSKVVAEIMPDKGKRGAILSTLKNFDMIMKTIGATLRYNVIKKDQEIVLPGEEASLDNKKNVLFARITDLCRRIGMPVGEIEAYLGYWCDQHQYNPVATWIESKPWDGIKRFEHFAETVKAEDETLKNTLIKKWMLSAIAAAYRPNGVMSPGILVFRGNQGIGKTKWFKRLVPQDLELTADGKILRADDKDSVKQAISYWLVELGELDATFKKSDIAQLKAFITKDTDMLRLPYARKECQYPRRTIFFGSVNNREFLADSTGNRRFWVVECSEIDHEHNFDMQQVWAEILEAYRQGENWWLTDSELAALNKSNEAFEMMDPIEEKLVASYDWEVEFSEKTWKKKTGTEVMEELNLDSSKKVELNRCVALIRKLNRGVTAGRFKGRKVLWVAPRNNVLSRKEEFVGDVQF